MRTYHSCHNLLFLDIIHERKTCGRTEFYPFAWTESDDGRISSPYNETGWKKLNYRRLSVQISPDMRNKEAEEVRGAPLSILIYSYFGTFRQSTATGQNGQGRDVTGRNDTQRNVRARCYRA